MADQTFEAQQFADALARASAEFERYGKLTQSTQNDVTDASMKAKYGLNNFTAASTKGAEAAINLGKVFTQAAGAMYQGKKGAAAFNDSVDSLTSAAKAAAIGLALLGGPLGLLAAAVVTGIAALGEYTKAANEMSDKLYKGYQGLAESGAAAADGMDGLFEDAKKLGLSMNDLGQYTSLIAANSKDLALFSGTVYQGRQTFADVVEDMDKFKLGLMNTGLTQEQINAGAMSYLKLQTRIGLSQNKTTQELADGANKYLLEMDALSKVTGESRKGMEDTMESARSEQRFRAKLDAMRASGNQTEIDQARELELANVVLSSQSKEMGQAFRDVQSGLITTEAAQKGFISTQGELMRSSDQLRKGQISYMDLVDNVGRSVGRFNKALNATAQYGALNEFAIDYSQGQQLAIFTQKSATEKLRLANIMVGKQAAGADAAVDANSRLIISQQKGNEATERFIKAGIVGTTEAMIVLANASTAAADTLNALAGVKTRKTGKALQGPGSFATQSPGSGGNNAKFATQGGMTGTSSSKPTTASSSGGSAFATGGGMTATQGGGQSRTIGAASTDKPIAAVIGAGAGFTKVTAMDGENQSREGARNWRNNNPGNLEFGPFAKSSGAVGTDGRFAVFSTLDAGMAAKEKLLFDTKSYAGLSIEQAISKYAPSFENNTAAYAKNVANAAGVTAATKLSDLNSSQRKSFLDAINRVEGFKEGKIVSAADGGMFGGPTSGYPATLHGDEAVIPLKDGAVPVSLSLKDALSKPSMMGQSEYSGYNMGPMSTDINAVRDIATSMGAFDKASQTITNPETWKQIINSGVAMNYDMGMAKLGTSLVPGIGIEIGNAVKDLQEQKHLDTQTAINEITK